MGSLAWSWCLSVGLVYRLDPTDLTIKPVALQGKGSNCFSIIQPVGQKRHNKVSKCKLKKYLFGNKTKENPANIATRALFLIVL